LVTPLCRNSVCLRQTHRCDISPRMALRAAGGDGPVRS